MFAVRILRLLTAFRSPKTVAVEKAVGESVAKGAVARVETTREAADNNG